MKYLPYIVIGSVNLVLQFHPHFCSNKLKILKQNSSNDFFPVPISQELLHQNYQESSLWNLRSDIYEGFKFLEIHNNERREIFKIKCIFKELHSFAKICDNRMKFGKVMHLRPIKPHNGCTMDVDYVSWLLCIKQFFYLT